MKTKYRILVVVAPFIFVFDQLTKLAVRRWISFGERRPVVPDFFDLVYFRNAGAAFGMFSGLDDALRIPLFYSIAAIAAAFLILYFRSLGDEERAMPMALAMVFGGIAGNTLDRVRLGAVVDFLSFHIGDSAFDCTLFCKKYHIPLEWPAFNVADSAITMAMAIIVWRVIMRREDIP